MAFEKGVSGNPGGKPKQKPFRDALAMEAALAENGEDTPAKKGSLRHIARQLLERAGDDTQPAREVADRLDGKPAQALEHSGDLTSAMRTRCEHLMMDPTEKRIRKRPRDDFRHYVRKCLKIRTGAVEPLILNRAQEYIHSKLEEQRARTGKVRALILKGRQQGCSTYVEGRYYHRTTHSRGLRSFILTHELPATENLFETVNRYHEHCPLLVRPSTGAANAEELFFDGLVSAYKVGTAGTKGIGRSSTLQPFHGSEVGFWPPPETHAAGVLQALPDEPGTEIILESSANGVGGFFHSKWRDAEQGGVITSQSSCRGFGKRNIGRQVGRRLQGPQGLDALRGGVSLIPQMADRNRQPTRQVALPGET